jgi:c-di-GMP-binding flagellar brake protein YcgR
MTTATAVNARNRRSSMRRVPRSTVKVECRQGPCGLGKNLVVRLLDLSEGGMRLVLTTALAAKSEVEVLIFGAAQGRPLKRVANVCWCEALEDGNVCVGLEFQKRLQFSEVAQNVR